MRSAGCVINDYADRNVDGGVERTKNRPLVTGAVTKTQAICLFAGLVASAGLWFIFESKAPLAVAGLALTMVYPFMNTPTCLKWFWVLLSWGILMAGSAQDRGILDVLLFIGSLFWIVAYDTQYAMVDRDDDLVVGGKAPPSYSGR